MAVSYTHLDVYKRQLLSPAFVKSLNIEDFVAKERFANGRVCPLCGCIHVVRNGHLQNQHAAFTSAIVQDDCYILTTETKCYSCQYQGHILVPYPPDIQTQ